MGTTQPTEQTLAENSRVTQTAAERATTPTALTDESNYKQLQSVENNSHDKLLLHEMQSGESLNAIAKASMPKLPSPSSLGKIFYNVGLCYENGGKNTANGPTCKGHFVQSFAKAAHYFRKSARMGYPLGEASLGYAYYYGQGVQKDYNKAIFWYRRAAAKGNVQAEINLGVAYYYGQGVPGNLAQALFWMRKAAAQGSKRAMGYVSFLEARGRSQ